MAGPIDQLAPAMVASPGVESLGASGAEIETTRHGWSAEIALEGEVDLAEGPALQGALAEALGGGPIELLVVDMTAATFLDSSVVHWLVECHGRAASTGARLVALAPEPPARDVLDLLDVGAVVPLMQGR